MKKRAEEKLRKNKLGMLQLHEGFKKICSSLSNIILSLYFFNIDSFCQPDKLFCSIFNTFSEHHLFA